jgi:hypothetical protein
MPFSLVIEGHGEGVLFPIALGTDPHTVLLLGLRVEEQHLPAHLERLAEDVEFLSMSLEEIQFGPNSKFSDLRKLAELLMQSKNSGESLDQASSAGILAFLQWTAFSLVQLQNTFCLFLIQDVFYNTKHFSNILKIEDCLPELNDSEADP